MVNGIQFPLLPACCGRSKGGRFCGSRWHGGPVMGGDIPGGIGMHGLGGRPKKRGNGTEESANGQTEITPP